ncbi:MAG: hypothetical protein H6609_05690 [Ignavibacteriales bacterium]|nr:hypothetical protein [Ignavibacteriales bacterium]
MIDYTEVFKLLMILISVFDFNTGTGSSYPFLHESFDGSTFWSSQLVTNNEEVFIAADGTTESILSIINPNTRMDITPSPALSGPATSASIDILCPINGITPTGTADELFGSRRLGVLRNETESRIFFVDVVNCVVTSEVSSIPNCRYLTRIPPGFDLGGNNSSTNEAIGFFSANGEPGKIEINPATNELMIEIFDINANGPSFPDEITFINRDILTPQSGLTKTQNYQNVDIANNIVYAIFEAEDETNGREIWISDGTASGTNMVKDINTSGSSYPFSLTPMNGKVYFFASSMIVNNGLWVTDGTEAGTQLVKDFNPGGGYNFVDNIININNTLYFLASDGTNGAELWKSDGTTSGTVMIKDIHPGTDQYSFANNSSPRGFTLFNGLIYFSANDGIHGRELWVTDGTAGGTKLVKNINNTGDGTEGSYPLLPGLLNGGVFYFYADNGIHGYELWVTDGTSEGTKLAYDLKEGPDDSNFWAGWGRIANGNLFVSADDGINGFELFVFENVPTSVPATNVGLKIMLEGPYNSGVMNNTSASNIPLNQPFNNALWNYYGDETTTNSIISSNNIVDWILIELRKGSSAESAVVVGKKAVLLKSDGTVMDSNGNSDVLFKWVEAGDYYISVYHRNHLSVLSSQTVNLTNN